MSLKMTMESVDIRPWYQKLREWRPTKKTWQVLEIAFLVLVLIIFLAYGEIRKRQSNVSKAASAPASLFMKPTEAVMPPEARLEIWTDTAKSLGFARVIVKFDPALVKMVQDVAVTGPLTRVVQLTPFAEANASGVMTLVLGLDPAQLAAAPSGTFKLAEIRLTTSSLLTATTTVGFDSANMQLVATDTSVFTISGAASANVSLNPVASPSPAVNPSASPVPSPVTNDTSAPVVSFNSPTNGEVLSARGNTSISVTASDQSGIQKIEIYFDGSLKKTCNGTNNCSFGFKLNKASSGSHTFTAKATDKSAAKNQGQAAVTVSIP